MELKVNEAKMSEAARSTIIIIIIIIRAIITSVLI